MALSVVENPVVTEDGVTKNLFAGFEPVEYKFKREDSTITGVGQGIDNQILVNLSIDLSSYLSIGDTIYVYSEGLTYTYDLTGQIVAITSSTITISEKYIEAGSSGYINYKRNYYLEVELVNPDNSEVNILPFSLIDDGDSKGNITIDVSIANDLNIQFYEFLRQELTEMRTIFKVQYREVYDIDTGTYIELVDTLILAYATEQPEYESFLSKLDDPKLWKGYPFGVILSHTESNADDTGLNFKYDELDINQSDLTTDNELGTLPADDEGFLFVNIDKDMSYNAQTQYIKVKADYEGLKFFSPDFFDNAFFDA